MARRAERPRLDFDFDGYGETAAGAEGLLRDLEDGRGLLAFVFTALDQREDTADEAEVDFVSNCGAGRI